MPWLGGAEQAGGLTVDGRAHRSLGPARSGRPLAPGSVAHRLRALGQLLGRHVLDVGGNGPAVPPGVLEPADAVAVELVLDGAAGALRRSAPACDLEQAQIYSADDSYGAVQ